MNQPDTVAVGTNLFAQLFQPSELVLFSPIDVLMAMLVSTLLSFMLAHAYRETHRGVSYSQSFLVTMILMSVSISIVMMIIGSNIARAFSLVGALSIIRFRTAVKDPRDTGFLFVAMIAGMGCGTKFYLPAIALTVFVCLLVLVLHHIDYGVKQRLDTVLRVTFPEGGDVQGKLEGELGKHVTDFNLVNRIVDFGDGNVTNVYVVRPRKSTTMLELESHLRKIDGVRQLARYETDQHAPI
jgi:hypothetical protein